MVERTNLAELYKAPVLDFEVVLAGVDAAFARSAQDDVDHSISWLSTVNADGSPHCTPVGAAWVDHAFWFQGGARTRKARNVARDPRCSIARQFPEFDLVVEGNAVKINSPEEVARLAEYWAARGWPAEPDDSGTMITAPYNAQSTGAGPWQLYRIDPTSAVAVQKVEPYGATRWRF